MVDGLHSIDLIAVLTKRFKLFILLVSIGVFGLGTRAQVMPKLGINETDYYYSADFNTPDKLYFVLRGDPHYKTYFYNSLKKHLRALLRHKNIQFSFKPLQRTSRKKDVNFVLYLDINNAVVLQENSGYDRIMKFNFSGKLVSLLDNKKLFGFNSHVYVIHDINNQNVNLGQYLIDKIFKPEHKSD